MITADTYEQLASDHIFDVVQRILDSIEDAMADCEDAHSELSNCVAVDEELSALNKAKALLQRAENVICGTDLLKLL